MNWRDRNASLLLWTRDRARMTPSDAFPRGDLLRLRLVSDRDAFHAMHHPIHLHGQRFLVAAVNGVPVENHAWKDTVVVPGGGAVDILIEFSNPGRWMLHCHVAEHLESGMQTVFTVE